MRRFVLLAAGAVLALAGVAVTASGGGHLSVARWAVEDLGTLGGKESYAAAINGKDVVVGWAETKKGDTRPALWRNRRPTNLAAPTSSWDAWATGINDQGEVIGLVQAVWEGEDEHGSSTFGFAWHPGSLIGLHGMDERAYDEPGYSQVRALNEQGTMVGWLGGYDGDIPYVWDAPSARGGHYYPFHDGVALSKARFGRAFDLNELGQVVGESYRSYKTPTHAALWEDGALVDLGTLGGKTSTALLINDRGVVAGRSQVSGGRWHAVAWYSGEALDLRPRAGLPNSSVTGLNERGQVIGWSAKALGDHVDDLPRSPRACIWVSQKPRDLGTLGGASAIPFAINERGVVVGQSQNARGEWQAFVWQNGKMTALPTLGGTFSAALAINDASRIVGWSRTPKNVKHAVLWTPKR